MGHFCPPGSGSGSKDLIESGSNPDPDSKHCVRLSPILEAFYKGVPVEAVVERAGEWNTGEAAPAHSRGQECCSKTNLTNSLFSLFLKTYSKVWGNKIYIYVLTWLKFIQRFYYGTKIIKTLHKYKYPYMQQVTAFCTFLPFLQCSRSRSCHIGSGNSESTGIAMEKEKERWEPSMFLQSYLMFLAGYSVSAIPLLFCLFTVLREMSAFDPRELP